MPRTEKMLSKGLFAKKAEKIIKIKIIAWLGIFTPKKSKNSNKKTIATTTKKPRIVENIFIFEIARPI